jgi:dimethylargininase
MLTAITRQVSPSINKCELTHLKRQPIDFELARKQHEEYKDALRSLGVMVISLPVEANLPDSVFVEDTAIVLDEIALIARPGAESRRPEIPSITAALSQFRNVNFLKEPATLDGGDVLVIGKSVYVGLSSRSNPNALTQLQNILDPYGYCIKGVEISGCLHLKSAVTQVADHTLLINPKWIDKKNFPSMEFIEIDPAEPLAANALIIGNEVIYPINFPRTRALLEIAGVKTISVDVGEIAKAEGAVTCCSLVFNSLG